MHIWLLKAEDTVLKVLLQLRDGTVITDVGVVRPTCAVAMIADVSRGRCLETAVSCRQSRFVAAAPAGTLAADTVVMAAVVREGGVRDHGKQQRKRARANQAHRCLGKRVAHSDFLHCRRMMDPDLPQFPQRRLDCGEKCWRGS